MPRSQHLRTRLKRTHVVMAAVATDIYAVGARPALESTRPRRGVDIRDKRGHEGVAGARDAALPWPLDAKGVA
jgi:hypothetical protein